MLFHVRCSCVVLFWQKLCENIKINLKNYLLARQPKYCSEFLKRKISFFVQKKYKQNGSFSLFEIEVRHFDTTRVIQWNRRLFHYMSHWMESSSKSAYPKKMYYLKKPFLKGIFQLSVVFYLEIKSKQNRFWYEIIIFLNFQKKNSLQKSTISILY